MERDPGIANYSWFSRMNNHTDFSGKETLLKSLIIYIYLCNCILEWTVGSLFHSYLGLTTHISIPKDLQDGGSLSKAPS